MIDMPPVATEAAPAVTPVPLNDTEAGEEKLDPDRVTVVVGAPAHGWPATRR